MFASKVNSSPNPTPSSVKIDSDTVQQVTAAAIPIMITYVVFMYFLDCLFVVHLFHVYHSQEDIMTDSDRLYMWLSRLQGLRTKYKPPHSVPN